jgi:hypothetical protein
MDKLGIQGSLLIIQLFALYPVIKTSTYQLAQFLYALTRSKNGSILFVSILFLPGTIIHEMSHFFAATALLLPVDEVRIFPEWHGDKIWLGKVGYRSTKSDFIRPILVGIAPVFGAVSVFIFLKIIGIFPSENIGMNVVIGYFLYSISANMFSSKQDLVDLIYAVPVLIIAGALWYISGITIRFKIPDAYVSGGQSVLQFVNFCITISLVTHIGLIVVIRILRFMIKR